VVLLRDAEGLTGGEVGQLLQVNQAGQRVLLHRGRPGAGEPMAWQRAGILCRKAADQVTECLEDALPPP